MSIYKDEQIEVTEGAVTRGGMTYQIGQLENLAVTELTIFGRLFLWCLTAFFGFFAFIMIGSIGEYPVHFFVPAILAGGCGYSAVTKPTKWRIMAKQGLQEPTLYESYDKAKVEEVAAVIRGQM